MKKRTGTVVAITGMVAMLGLGVIGGGALAAALDSPNDGSELRPIGTNESGQTYGSNLGSTSPDTDPDLILVIGDSGLEGYVYASELNEPAPASPADAVSNQTAPGEVEAVLDVYLSDGTTKIDTFTILGGAAEG